MQRMAKVHDPIDQRLRENLQKFIAESGYTQNQVADLSGVPQANLSRYLRGENAIPANVLPLLAEALGRDPGDFYAAAPPPANIEDAAPVLFKARPGVELTEEEAREIEELRERMKARRAKKNAARRKA